MKEKDFALEPNLGRVHLWIFPYSFIVCCLKTKFSVHTARFLKYVWPFYNTMHERVNNKNFIIHIHFIILLVFHKETLPPINFISNKQAFIS